LKVTLVFVTATLLYAAHGRARRLAEKMSEMIASAPVST